MKISAFVISCLFFLLSLFSFAPTSHAASSIDTKDSIPPTTNVDSNVPDTLHNWTQTVMIEVMSAVSCQLTGVDPINTKQGCLGIDQKNGKIGFLPSPQTGGAIGFMGDMIAALYTPPIHTSDYFQNLASNFGITKKVYAQSVGGTGFNSIYSLIDIWTAFRNIVYLILVMIFAVIGLAIMLRLKIDPRTVMTIQNQIPKIIIGILAVTFSFAIAGFLIDIMWILIYVFYNTISTIPNVNIDNLNPDVMQNKNLFSAIGIKNIFGIVSNSSRAVGDIIYAGVTGAMPTNFFLKALLSLSGVILRFIGGLIAYLIFAAALLTALFRLWIVLIKAYVQILLDIVLAPFWIIGGIIPGSQLNFSGWLRDMAANLLAFPVIIALFMLAKVFTDIFGQTSSIGSNFVPPLIGYSGDTSLIAALIGLGIMLMTPNVVTMLKTALKTAKIETGLGQALKPGLAGPSRIVQAAGTNLTTRENPSGFRTYNNNFSGTFGKLMGFKTQG